ncbi:Methane monooxygenase component A alpha chain [Bienertia sinuspersici]
MSSNSEKIDTASPLYLHPSDGTNSVTVEKLQGTSNYKEWRRDFEITLAAKRKLGFVIGGVKKDENDVFKRDCWETCNNMVISWILHSVSEQIKNLLSNGARKYSLNKLTYETKQQGKLVSEYYTEMKVVWEELESLSIMPALTEMTVEVVAYVNALRQQ